MRAILWQDLVLAARAAACMPQDERGARLAIILERAHAADKYRKATGRVHGDWGDGTLAATLRGLPLGPRPARSDPAHCAALMAVLRAITDWRAVRDWNREPSCTSLVAMRRS